MGVQVSNCLRPMFAVNVVLRRVGPETGFAGSIGQQQDRPAVNRPCTVGLGGLQRLGVQDRDVIDRGVWLSAKETQSKDNVHGEECRDDPSHGSQGTPNDRSAAQFGAANQFGGLFSVTE